MVLIATLFFYKINMETIVLLGVVVYLFAMNQYNAITYNLDSVKVIKWAPNYVQIEININLSNGSLIPISIDGFIGSIEKNGIELSKLALLNVLNIQSEKTGLIRLGAKISYSGAASGLIDWYQTGSNEVTIKGSIIASGKTIPVKFKTTLW